MRLGIREQFGAGLKQGEFAEGLQSASYYWPSRSEFTVKTPGVHRRHHFSQPIRRRALR